MAAGYIAPMVLSVALLRAVNVGTANRMRMEALTTVMRNAGFADAVTYIQSGNVIFTPQGDESATRAAIETQLAADLGMTITSIVRTGAELADVISRNPFATSTDDDSRLHVSFLLTEPAADDVAALSAMVAAGSFGDDELAVNGREVFLRYATRAGTSKLTGSVLEKKLRTPATARNWAVTNKLAELSR